MPYCTQTDLEAAYGVEEILKTQPRAVPYVDPPQVDTAAVEAAIQAATDEIDSYVMERYRLPLSDSAAARLKRRCVDMAMYHLAYNANGEDNAKRTRYEDALAWLKMIAEGKAVLVPRPQARITSEPRRDFRLPTNYFDGPYDGRRLGSRYS